MARNENVSIPAKVWTELTNANADAASWHVLSQSPVTFQVTTGSAPAADALDGPQYTYLQGQATNVTFAQLFPTVTGGNRLWARCAVPAEIWVSHADAA